ncbi:MAG: glycosyltransferase family 4 protein [Planctomycetota bacterium]|jgi:glycosyltransferase involved in cell wall biosynthesis
MRIIQLTPGSGDNFYCENCLRDLTLVRAMQQAGSDMLMVPMYLPIEIESAPIASDQPIFFGGLNVYLQQKCSLFRKTPRWMDKWLDAPALLRQLGKFAGMTNAKELGQTTLSMLKGADGKQLKELDRLVDWLQQMDPEPDVIVLSNILLAGLAPALKERLKIPVVCLLQDEEGFLDSLAAPYDTQCWDLVREHAKSFDALIAISDYFQDIMADRLQVDADQIQVIPMGLKLDDFDLAAPLPDVPTVGFLSRTSYDHGLDILINAVHILKRDENLAQTKLRITGGSSPADKRFLKQMAGRIEALDLTDSIEFIDNYDRQRRIEFLQSLSVMVLPSRQPLAYGLFAMEACAAARPFVVPDIGVFKEIATKTQAGVLYEPNNPVKLAETLKPLLNDPQTTMQLGQKGRSGIEQHYTIEKTVNEMTELFNSLIQ